MIISNIALINETSVKLNILKEIGEHEQHWYRRIMVSLIGGHMLSALYDFDDDFQSTEQDNDKTVSMQHILKRGQNLISTFAIDNFDCERLRDLFIQTGYMLHKKNRLTYPMQTIASEDNIAFIRGIPPWESVFMSGNGMYILNHSHSEISVEQMFGIEEQNIDKWFSNFLERLNWQKTDRLQNIEFLNISDNTKHGYWQAKPPRQGLTLCKTKNSGEIEYKILRFSNIIEECPLPGWETENGEYYRIAIALRIANGNTPAVTVRLRKHTADFILDYLLPTPERNFFELYSWSSEFDSRWRRTIAISLYPTFKRIFERLGYKINEVQ